MKLVTHPPPPIFFSNEYDTQNTNNLLLDSCSLSSFVKINICFIVLSPLFCDFTWRPPKRSFSTLSLENLNEVQRCSELLHQDGLRHLFVGFFFMLIFTKSIKLSSTTHWHILWYLTLMCFVLLWYMWSLVRWLALWVSQWIWTESYIIPKILTDPLNHKSSFDSSTAAMLCLCR